MQQPFLITGFGRSGTTYVAELLKQLGVPCGHEAVFNLKTTQVPKWAGGESSWLAAPKLKEIPADVPVVHLLRHPTKTIASWLAKVNLNGHYATWACEAVDWHAEDPAERVAGLWLRWTELVEKRQDRHVLCIESLDARKLIALVQHIRGETIDRSAAEAALTVIPRNVNTRGSTDTELVRAREQWPLIADVAEKYGYASPSTPPPRTPPPPLPDPSSR